MRWAWLKNRPQRQTSRALLSRSNIGLEGVTAKSIVRLVTQPIVVPRHSKNLSAASCKQRRRCCSLLAKQLILTGFAHSAVT